MARTKLTKAAVERLPAPDPSGKQVLHLDTEVPGFGVLCSGTTSAKSYIAQKRWNGVLRRVTIGSCAHLKLDEARAEAKEKLVALGKGIDSLRLFGRAFITKTTCSKKRISSKPLRR